MRIAVCLSAALVAGAANADVNTCSIGGNVVFQEAPCPGAKLERRDSAQPSAHEASAAAGYVTPSESSPAANALKARLAVYEHDRRLREDQQQIEAFQNAISERNAQMTRELAPLKDMKRSAANNSAGAQWEQSISGELGARQSAIERRPPAATALSTVRWLAQNWMSTYATH